MDPANLDLRPPSLSEADWDSMTPGFRIRFVHANQYELLLRPEQYALLRRLPYWLFYGPEQGAPAEWYNPDGLLLPKYRPGGGSFDRFREWRREYKRHRWIHHLTLERLTLLRERFKTAYAVAGLLGTVALYLVSRLIAGIWFEEMALIVVTWALWGVLLALAVGVLEHVRRAFVRYQVTRRSGLHPGRRNA